jgi:hypothetical protein
MRQSHIFRAVATVALIVIAALPASALASAGNAGLAEESQPVVSIVLNEKGKPVFSPTRITMRLSSRWGCNFAVQNTTSSSYLIAYGSNAGWKRAFNLAPGGLAGWGISVPMTSHLKIWGYSSVLTEVCRK